MTMKEAASASRSSHEESQYLLPWYVNGTLTTSEREAIDAHLSQCSACLAELETLRAVGVAIKNSNERLSYPPAQMDTVLARVEEFESHRAREKGFARLGRWWHSLPALSKAAIVAPALAAIVLAGLSVALLRRANNLEAAARLERERANMNETLLAEERQRAIQYQALSGRPVEAGGDRIRITVVFREHATEKEIRELLLSIKGAAIVTGPSPERFYVVALAVEPGSDSQKLRHEVVAQLRRRSDVVQLAEPLP